MNLPFLNKKPIAAKPKPKLQSSKQQPIKVLGKRTRLPAIAFHNKYLDIIVGDVKRVFKRDDKSIAAKVEYQDFMEEHFGK